MSMMKTSVRVTVFALLARVAMMLLGLFAVTAIAQDFEQNGIKVHFNLEPLARPGARPVADVDAAFRFDISDATGAAVSGAYPAVWMQRRAETMPTGKSECQNMVKSFIGGSVMSQPTLNLNVYYVLVMNDDASISVVDPLFGFGGSNLLNMIPLSSPGYDWAMSEQQSRLLVSLPESKKLAVVDIASFKVLTEIELGVTPDRVVLQPDHHYAWIGYNSSGANGGVLVIDVGAGKLAKRIATGPGKHQISFAADNRYAFIASDLDGRVTVVDIAKLEQVKDIDVGGKSAALAYSPAADALYITDSQGGFIIGINVKTLEVNSRTDVAPGLGQIRFAPGGRFAVVLNPVNDMVYIFDAVNDRIVKSGKVEEGPDQVSFSDTLAHIRHRGSETVFMLSMDVITDPDVAMQVVDFPAGESAFGMATTPADGIVQTPGENAVLVAHPVDRQVYYYKEGMAAPMGSFNNFNRRARAVLAVDRTLQETKAGRYETVARLNDAGVYDVVFFMESPRVVHCFATTVSPNKERQAKLPHQIIAQRLSSGTVTKGKTTTLRFRLRDALLGTPITGLADLSVLTVLSPGIWQAHQPAKELGDGVYSVELLPPRSGAYYVSLDSLWRSKNLAPPGMLMFQVSAAE